MSNNNQKKSVIYKFMSKIDPDKEIEDIARLAEESEKRQKEKEHKLNSNSNMEKKLESSSMPAFLSFIVIALCLFGLYQIYTKSVEKNDDVYVAAFQSESNCKIFSNKNIEFANIDCSLAKKQAENKSKTTNGGFIHLKGEAGAKCYRIDSISGFAIVKGKDKKLFYTLPLYYTRNIDINSALLSYPSGEKAEINRAIKLDPIEIAKLAKQSSICY